MNRRKFLGVSVGTIAAPLVGNLTPEAAKAVETELHERERISDFESDAECKQWGVFQATMGSSCTVMSVDSRAFTAMSSSTLMSVK